MFDTNIIHIYKFATKNDFYSNLFYTINKNTLEHFYDIWCILLVYLQIVNQFYCSHGLSIFPIL